MISLETYREIARHYRGTEASAAIIGLITEVKRLGDALAEAEA